MNSSDIQTIETTVAARHIRDALRVYERLASLVPDNDLAALARHQALCRLVLAHLGDLIRIVSNIRTLQDERASDADTEIDLLIRQAEKAVAEVEPFL